MNHATTIRSAARALAARHALAALAIIVLVAGLAGPAAADEPTRWLNVHVTEPGTETNVEVHLPLSLVVSVIDSINVEGFEAGKIDLELDDADIDWPAVLAAVAEAPDGEFVRAKTQDADVSIVKRQAMIYVDVTEHEGDNAVVKVTLPVALLQSLNIDNQNKVDVKALLGSIDQLPDGELVRVTSDDANVRIWVE
jgi:hypothetical protein